MCVCLYVCVCVCVCTHLHITDLTAIMYNSHTTAYGELKSNELYAFAMMDTRKGQPQANGILPSLLVLDYRVPTSKVERNMCK